MWWHCKSDLETHGDSQITRLKAAINVLLRQGVEVLALNKFTSFALTSASHRTGKEVAYSNFVCTDKLTKMPGRYNQCVDTFCWYSNSCPRHEGFWTESHLSYRAGGKRPASDATSGGQHSKRFKMEDGGMDSQSGASGAMAADHADYGIVPSFPSPSSESFRRQCHSPLLPLHQHFQDKWWSQFLRSCIHSMYTKSVSIP